MQKPWAKSPPTMPWDPSGTSESGEPRKRDTKKRGRLRIGDLNMRKDTDLGLHFVNDCL